ncbi:hypothetical protein X770_00845 [Mesorhizobium sp. LSJC269B00]|uniref:ATP-binding protein n=1 Tax=Mesorhizobium sp. LSJC269B00 TaxID=1287326 RepID=UPI0003CE9406|nr:ATP-binding protein [Mesorhizobium sp. LSJC269B00]ESW93807.1 hypothetical protein X770_00845 [Mesorhizobium sp. LSJC269B00]
MDPYWAACVIRIERLLRARALVWQATLARQKPDSLWGVPHVPRGEVDAQLAHPPLGIVRTDPLPKAAQREVKEAGEMDATLNSLRAGAIESRLRIAEDAFALEPLERDLLLLATLPEFDVRYRRLFGYLMDDAMLAWPSFEFADAALAPLHKDVQKALAPDAVLLATGLVLAVPAPSGPSGPKAQRGLRACAEIIDWLRGGDGIDRETIAPAKPWRPSGKLPEGVSDDLLKIARLIREVPQLVVRANGPGAADPLPYRHLASAAGRSLLSCPAEDSHDELRVRAAARSARLNSAILHLTIAPASDAAARAPDIGMTLARHVGPIVLTLQPGALCPAGISSRPALDLALALPGFEERRAFWAGALAVRALAAGVDAYALALELADRYRLNHSGIEAAAAQAETSARLRDPRDPKLERADLVGACRRQTSTENIELARRILPDQLSIELDDLVLTPGTRRRVADLVQRLGQRRRVLSTSGLAGRLPLGHGTVALFTGPAGTGKTIGAILIAKQLGLDLLKADLGSLVSKYVGETEQRLDRLFANAENTDAMLFFDEADALFGRRGEVKEARDRWANLETNYLLQRVEEFDGIVILATNLRRNIDEAFMRRIDVAIDFPMPDATLRAALWRSLIPPGVEPPPAAELKRLAAALPLAGGHIKSIVVDAVHRAYAAHGADSGQPRLTLRHLVESAARTYEKLGRPVGSGEFATEWLAWVREGEGK